MATRKLHMQSLYLEPEKATLLDSLAAETRIPKAVLLREAVDDLLTKHGKAQRPSNVVPLESSGKRKARKHFDEIARGLGKNDFSEIEADVAFYKRLPAKARRARTTKAKKS